MRVARACVCVRACLRASVRVYSGSIVLSYVNSTYVNSMSIVLSFNSTLACIDIVVQ